LQDARTLLQRTNLVALAAKARVIEALSSGDVRVLAAELRADLEKLAGAGAEVIAIARRRR
jgi:hypothetical protein